LSGPIFAATTAGTGEVSRANWTALIPAAGRGTRLAYDKPKILYPVLGRPLLDWLVDALQEVCSRFVLVLSPEGREAVEPVARARLGNALEIRIQSTPLGMADAVQQGLPAVSTPNTLVVWGDQVTLRPQTIRACAAVHEANPVATLTLASCMRRDPYVSISRDASGRILEVHQARESEVRGAVGENDCGLFLFSTPVLAEVLADARSRNAGVGAQTGEFNLLPLLPCFEREPGSVRTVRIEDLGETVGINSRTDVATAEKILGERRAAEGRGP